MTDLDLYRSAGGQKLHIPACPHVHGVELVLANDEERLHSEICSWCQAELDGKGRTYHETLEGALDDLGAPRRARAELARLLKQAPHDQIWVPHSRSYVAVAHNGQMTAWSGMSYVQYRDGRIVELPHFVRSAGGGTATAEEQWGGTCADCFTARSISGHCLCA